MGRHAQVVPPVSMQEGTARHIFNRIGWRSMEDTYEVAVPDRVLRICAGPAIFSSTAQSVSRHRGVVSTPVGAAVSVSNVCTDRRCVRRGVPTA